MRVVINKLPKRNDPGYFKAWMRKNPIKQTLHQIKCRCKRDGLEFDLEEKDIVVPEVCPVLNIPIKRNDGSGWHNDSPSVDRIDNNRGYTKDNIRVISNRANRLKCDATLEELELILADARRIKS